MQTLTLGQFRKLTAEMSDETELEIDYRRDRSSTRIIGCWLKAKKGRGTLLGKPNVIIEAHDDSDCY